MLTTGSRLERSHGTNAISAAAEMRANVTMKFDFEPIVALPFVEHDLQRSKAKRDEREADEIKIQELALPCLLLAAVGGIFDKAVDKKQRQKTHGNVDEKYRRPYSTRKKIKDPRFQANPHSSELTVKTATQSM